MKKINLIILFLSLILVFNSCSSLNEAGKVLRNEKKNSTDEFLVKKREPLTQPPDFEKIPEPGSIKKEQKARVDSNNIERSRGNFGSRFISRKSSGISRKNC